MLDVLLCGGNKVYFRFSSVWCNHLKNKLLVNYLRNRGNDLAIVRISAICGAMLSNNSSYYIYNDFLKEQSVII